MNSLAVCPGSFDPITLGHVDVARRAQKMFGRVILGVAENSSKNALFSLDERVLLAREAVAEAGLVAVTVEPIAGLLAEFAAARGATAIVKGLRGSADFDAEQAMALLNRHLTGIETVLIMGEPALNHVASSFVKDIARFGADVTGLVPQAVAHALRKRFSDPAAGDGGPPTDTEN